MQAVEQRLDGQGNQGITSRRCSTASGCEPDQPIKTADGIGGFEDAYALQCAGCARPHFGAGESDEKPVIPTGRCFVCVMQGDQ